MSYITVLGAGSWGTTLAVLLGQKDYDVTLWVYEEDLADEITRTGVNSVYLPDVVIPQDISVTSDLKKALSKARYIINVIPTQFMRPILSEAAPHIPENAVIVSASKGIENETYLTCSKIIRESIDRTVAVLSGPSFAKEVVKGLPTAVTLASEDYGTCLLLQEVFTTNYFRVYSHHDIVGVELGGALKNVMAIAAGISDGLGLGSNARSALITRALAEMTRLGVMMGANENTFAGLSGLGDLVLTCSSNLSRNYTVGFELGRGEKLSDIVSKRKSVAEGVATTKAANELARKNNVEMPIVSEVYAVLYEDKDPSRAVSDLMTRTPKAEFYG
jgi:glycerol-3-phosphate dehydrogenase (NAD(P)+)